MTEEAKKKGIEIGAGILLYIIAFAVTTYWTVPEIAESTPMAESPVPMAETGAMEQAGQAGQAEQKPKKSKSEKRG